MKTFFKIVSSLSLALIATACADSYLTESELREYVLDPANGLVSRVEKGPIAVEVVYHPKDLVKAFEGREMAKGEEFDKRMANIDSLEYFILRISRNGKEIETALVGNPARYNSAISYLSYGIRNDVRMRHWDDTISALDVVYAGSFGMAEATSVMTVFSGGFNELDGEVILSFDDHQFGTGRNEFVFDIDAINSIPRLKLN